MKSTRWLVTLVGISRLLGGCGNDRDFAADEAASECSFLEACCDADERARIYDALGVTDEAGCRAKLSESNAKQHEEYEHATYDPAAAEECLDQLAAQSCREHSIGVKQDACRHVFRGQLANGTACAQDKDCASGLCPRDHLCADLPRIGDACPDFECVEGADCRDGICAVRHAEGDACESLGDCESEYCNDEHVCAPAPPDSSLCDG